MRTVGYDGRRPSNPLVSPEPVQKGRLRESCLPLPRDSVETTDGIEARHYFVETTYFVGTEATRRRGVEGMGFLLQPYVNVTDTSD